MDMGVQVETVDVLWWVVVTTVKWRLLRYVKVLGVAQAIANFEVEHNLRCEKLIHLRERYSTKPRTIYLK